MPLMIAAACMLFAASVPLSLAAAENAAPVSYTATVQGSAPTTRQQIDNYSGSVYIYTGGPLPAYTSPAALRFLFGFAANDGKPPAILRRSCSNPNRWVSTPSTS